jgi:hypothetical protein
MAGLEDKVLEAAHFVVLASQPNLSFGELQKTFWKN